MRASPKGSFRESGGKPQSCRRRKQASHLQTCQPHILSSKDEIKSDCLYNLAETRGWLCSKRAGSHKLLLYEDQILRITRFRSSLGKGHLLAAFSKGLSIHSARLVKSHGKGPSKR